MTVAQILTDIKTYFPDVPQTAMLRKLNIVHNRLERKFDLSSATQSISLTAGTSEYALATGTIKVLNVRYRRSATASDYQALNPTSWDRLHVETPEWLGRANGEPLEYYQRLNVVGLDRPALTTTSGGYPILEVDASVVTALAADGNMPDVTENHEAWIYGTCLDLALSEQDARLNDFKGWYLVAFDTLAEFAEGKAIRAPHILVPPGATVPRATRR